MKLQLGFQAKVTLLVILITVSVIFFSLLVTGRMMRNALEKQLEEETVLVAQVLAEHITHGVIEDNVLLIYETLHQVVVHAENADFAYVVGFNGGILAHSFEMGFPKAFSNIRAGTLDGPLIEYYTTEDGPFLVVEYPLIRGMEGRVCVGVNESSLFSQIRSMQYRLISIGFVVALVWILLGFFMTRRIVRPLTMLTTSIQAFGEKGTEVPIVLTNTDGQVAEIIRSYNQMLINRKQAEEALRQSETKLRSIFQAAPIGIGLVSDRVFLEVNDELCEMLGYSRQELLGKNARFVYPSDEDYEYVGREKYAQIQKDGKGTVETRFKCKDGRIIDILLSSAPLDVNDLSQGVTFTALDITERKKAEQDLEYERSRLAKAQEIGSIGTWELDIVENVLLWTRENHNIFGVPDGSVLTYEAFLECVHPDDRGYVNEEWLAGVAGKPYDIEHRIIANGKVKWVREKAEMIFNDEGKAVRAIGVTQDITERKRAEEALKESERVKSAVLNNMAEHVIYQSLDMEILWANKAAAESIGLSSIEELAGRHCYEIWQNLNEPCQDCPVIKARQTNRPQAAEMTTPDGKIWLVFGSPVRDESGKVVAMMEVTLDVTERKQSEKKLLAYQEQLRSLASELLLAEERLRRRMAINVHDQIGQNLAISKIKIKSLSKSVSSPKAAKALNEVSDLITQTIESSRSLAFELSPPVLYELGFEAAVEWLVRQTKQQHDLSVKFRDDGNVKPLDNNVRVFLFQAVRELLVNVVKHAQAHHLTVSTQRVNGEIQVDVEDDGIGFNMSQIAFSNHKTSGFGLFSIRERLGHIGGGLKIESVSGSGTKATLTAPLNQEIAKEEEKHK